MKIAAQISDVKFLVEVSEDELNKITGEDKSQYRGRPYKIGQQFEVTKTWSYLKSILSKKQELFTQSRNLRAMADMIESIPVPSEESLENEIAKKSVEEHQNAETTTRPA
jgi:hypothetical protein